MPAQDGFWLIHEIRSRPTLRSLPAIAFTGLGRAHRKHIPDAAKDNPYTLWATIVHVARNRSRNHSM